MQRVERELSRLARRYGFTVRRTRNAHYQFLSGDQVVATTGGSPSDHRALRNLRADLRRAKINNSNG